MTISPLAAPVPAHLQSSVRQPPRARQATVNHLSAMYLYEQLAEILRDQIRSGQLPPGRTMPPIYKLAKQHKISDETARRAMTMLEEEHLVRVLQGREIFVLAQPPG
jgi:DNA-binding GntR family transcriptional regulator